MKTSIQGRFESLLESHLGIVFRAVRTYVRSAEDQLDLAQEIKLQLWRAFPKYDERRSFSTWMYRISLNTAISWTRRSSLRDQHSAALEKLDEHASASQFNDELHVLYHLIDQLDPLDRAVLMLYLEDLSHAEIAEILGITPINAATKVSRLKQKLRQQVNDTD